MNEYSVSLTGSEVGMAEDLDREFAARLVECSMLVFRIAYGVLRHREDAEDVGQEALTRAYRNFRNLREHDRFRAWLVRITWRLALDHKRSSKRRVNRESIPQETSCTESAMELLAAHERSARLWEAIDALPEKLRIVAVLAGIEEHDVRAIASLLDLPEGTVKSRLFLARQRLRELLQ
jgi:RNA polymerase sigma-70 factor (ECF subfamily)